MKAVHLIRLGSSENFEIVDVPKPVLSENEVLIRAKAVGVMYADVMQRKGEYLLQPPLPFIPGKEVSGIVEEVGSRVKNIKPGMRVMTLILIGGYAEYVKTFEHDVVVLPDRASFQQGLVYLANLPVSYLAYYVFGNVQPGDAILLHAAAGGIGTLITQIARRRGRNTLIALSSSDEKLEYCRKNGADHCINYRATDYTEAVLDLTHGQGVDIAFNSVSGSTLQTDPRCIKKRGRWIIYGSSGGMGTINPSEAELITKSLTIVPFSTYSVLGTDVQNEMLQFLDEWLATERLESPTKVFRLEDVGEAHTWIESQNSCGKVVLEI